MIAFQGPANSAEEYVLPRVKSRPRHLLDLEVDGNDWSVIPYPGKFSRNTDTSVIGLTELRSSRNADSSVIIYIGPAGIRRIP